MKFLLSIIFILIVNSSFAQPLKTNELYLIKGNNDIKTIIGFLVKNKNWNYFDTRTHPESKLDIHTFKYNNYSLDISKAGDDIILIYYVPFKEISEFIKDIKSNGFLCSEKSIDKEGNYFELWHGTGSIKEELKTFTIKKKKKYYEVIVY